MSTDRTSTSSRWATARRLLKVAIPLLAIVVVTRLVSWDEVVDIAHRVQPWWILAAFVVGVADRYWMAGKWRYLLTHLGVRIPFFEALTHYFVAGLVGYATQVQLSGDVTRAIRLGHQVGQRRAVITSVIIEKLMGVLAIGILALLSLALMRSSPELVSWRAPLALLVGGITIACLMPLLLFSERCSAMIERAVTRLPRWFGASRLAGLSSHAAELHRLRRPAAIFFLLTLGEQLMPMLTVVLLATGFGIQLEVVMVLMVMPTILFLTRLPVSVEAVGLREGLFAVLFGAVGLALHESLAIALTTRVLDLAVMGLGTIVCTALQAWNTRVVDGTVP